MAKVRHRRSYRRVVEVVQPQKTMADYFKAELGWKQPTKPFRTSAHRDCGSCGEVKPGSDFEERTIYPGRPSICRSCLG